MLFKEENMGVDKMEISYLENASKSKRFQKMFEQEIQKLKIV